MLLFFVGVILKPSEEDQQKWQDVWASHPGDRQTDLQTAQQDSRLWDPPFQEVRIGIFSFLLFFSFPCCFYFLTYFFGRNFSLIFSLLHSSSRFLSLSHFLLFLSFSFPFFLWCLIFLIFIFFSFLCVHACVFSFPFFFFIPIPVFLVSLTPTLTLFLSSPFPSPPPPSPSLLFPSPSLSLYAVVNWDNVIFSLAIFR